jgi:fermentation-respiration switch protein FrsA (DUF1100 family)
MRCPPPANRCSKRRLANLNPWTEAKVDTKNPERGPLLMISGEMDHTVPPAVVRAAYKQQEDNDSVTEIVEIKDRGHASPSTTAGAKSPKPLSPSSNGSRGSCTARPAPI